jgi:hypothetical protein
LQNVRAKLDLALALDEDFPLREADWRLIVAGMDDLAASVDRLEELSFESAAAAKLLATLFAEALDEPEPTVEAEDSAPPPQPLRTSAIAAHAPPLRPRPRSVGGHLAA